MKKLIICLLPLFFAACEKDEDMRKPEAWDGKYQVEMQNMGPSERTFDYTIFNGENDKVLLTGSTNYKTSKFHNLLFEKHSKYRVYFIDGGDDTTSIKFKIHPPSDSYFSASNPVIKSITVTSHDTVIGVSHSQVIDTTFAM
jgi:hypothetical protein